MYGPQLQSLSPPQNRSPLCLIGGVWRRGRAQWELIKAEAAPSDLALWSRHGQGAKATEIRMQTSGSWPSQHATHYPATTLFLT